MQVSLIFCLCLGALGVPTPTIMTTTGPVRGEITEGIEVFRGIPYAKPPVGDLRFQDPISIEPWTKTFEATKLGNDCPQFDIVKKLYWGNEDCLVLDVYVPHRPVKKPLPVYFWIYGGGWMLGSKWEFGLYDPFKLMADNDFIFIAPNYRLGPMGFLSLNGSSGMMGLLDQNLALKWAKANVAVFGGDPNHITIGGESAGAFSTCFHLVSPLSAGLFHAAIMESGTCDSPEFFRAKDNDLSFSHAFGMSFGCNGTDTEFTTCLRKIPAGALMSMYPDLSKYKKTHYIPALYPVMPWAATHEPDSVGLPDIPLRIMQSGKFNNVPLLIGTNANETNLFLFFLLEKMEPVYDDLFNDLFNNNQTFIAEIKKTYNWTSPLDKQRDVFSRLMTDYVFACPSRRAIRINNQKNTSWMYQWDYRSGLAEKLIGDGHATELVYVFQHPWALAEFTAKDRAMATMLKHYWVNFIKNYDPNSQSKPVYVNWLPYKSDSEYLLINDPTTTRMELDLDAYTCDFWDKYAASYV